MVQSFRAPALFSLMAVCACGPQTSSAAAGNSQQAHAKAHTADAATAASESDAGASAGSSAANTNHTANADAGGTLPTVTTNSMSLGAAGGAASAQSGSAVDSGGSKDAGTMPAAPPAFSHDFEDISLAAGEERTGLCQSWTLNNSAPVNVNSVVETNAGGFHHSNWIWVNDTDYSGPDGTWPCSDRGFDQILAGAVGGVFFAQSTQALTDTQAFPKGVAFTMPAHARIIGDLHLLNAKSAAVSTRLHFDLFALPDSEVRIPLQPMAFTNTALDIAAGGRTDARMQCNTPQPDFDIYYILPHFHALGQQMRLSLVGGPESGTEIFQSSGSLGEQWGKTFDPPIAVKGVDAIGITCEYQNPRARSVQYGEGDQEMCVVLIYSSGLKAGGTAITNVSVADANGIHSTDALCVSVGSP